MLKNHGYNVTILEKHLSAHREGYNSGIKIGPDVLEFIQKHSRISQEFTITCKAPLKFNMEGKARPEHSQTMTSTSWGLLVSFLRASFDGATSGVVPTCPAPEPGHGTMVFRNGAKVTEVKETDNNVEVHFEDVSKGTSHILTSNFVIVADGSTSSLRRILLPNVQRQYAGYVSWRGTVPEEAVDPEASKKYSGKFAFHLMDRNYILQ